MWACYMVCFVSYNFDCYLFEIAAQFMKLVMYGMDK